MNTNNNSRLRTAIGYIAFSFVVCVVAWFLYAYSISFFDSETAADDFHNFHVSFLASAAEDLLFFVVIGLGLFILSLRKPEDENLETRIGYLFSGMNATPAARQHALDVISKHACISPVSEMIVTVDKYHPDLKAFELTTEWDFVLANMYRDQPYIDKQVPLELFMDDIPVPDGMYGQVKAIRTKDRESGENQNFISAPESITTLEYSKHIPLEIKADGQVNYYVRFWHYSKLDGEYKLGVNRYTKELKISLVNSSGESIFYNVAGDSQQPRKELQDGASVEIYKNLAKPEDTGVILYLHRKQG